MAKSLLQQVMIKSDNKKKEIVDADKLVKAIEAGYTVNRIAKHQQKKTFAPSTIAYGHGECPRYWYLAFDGQTFEDNADAFAAANMTNGTLSHGRIQKAMEDAGILVNSEFKITYDNPPIFGFGAGKSGKL